MNTTCVQLFASVVALLASPRFCASAAFFLDEVIQPFFQSSERIINRLRHRNVVSRPRRETI